jgi:hypothetical protein
MLKKYNLPLDNCKKLLFMIKNYFNFRGRVFKNLSVFGLLLSQHPGCHREEVTNGCSAFLTDLQSGIRS